MKKVTINLSNKLFYSFIAFFIVLILSVGVYAFISAPSPGTSPNPGHTLAQIAPPDGCSSGQYLRYSVSSGGPYWSCETPVSSGTSFSYTFAEAQNSTWVFGTGQWKETTVILGCPASRPYVLAGGCGLVKVSGNNDFRDLPTITLDQKSFSEELWVGKAEKFSGDNSNDILHCKITCTNVASS